MTLRNDPQSFYKNLSVKTYNECLIAKTPQLSGIVRQFGPQLGDAIARAFLNIAIADLVKFLNVTKTMGADQIIQTVDLILDEFWMLKPEDFRLCFNNVKKGFYGKVYDRVDGMMIIEWLTSYTNGRDNWVEQFRQSENKRMQRELDNIKPSEGIPMPDWFKLPEKKAETQPQPICQRSEDQLIVDGLYREFDELYESQRNFDSGKRFVTLDGRKMDALEFINYRFEQIMQQ